MKKNKNIAVAVILGSKAEIRQKSQKDNISKKKIYSNKVIIRHCRYDFFDLCLQSIKE